MRHGCWCCSSRGHLRVLGDSGGFDSSRPVPRGICGDRVCCGEKWRHAGPRRYSSHTSRGGVLARRASPRTPIRCPSRGWSAMLQTRQARRLGVYADPRPPLEQVPETGGCPRKPSRRGDTSTVDAYYGPRDLHAIYNACRGPERVRGMEPLRPSRGLVILVYLLQGSYSPDGTRWRQRGNIEGDETRGL